LLAGSAMPHMFRDSYQIKKWFPGSWDCWLSFAADDRKT
jgi:hypothetical protein